MYGTSWARLYTLHGALELSGAVCMLSDSTLNAPLTSEGDMQSGDLAKAL